MSVQLIPSPDIIGLEEEVAANPGALIELRDDVLRDLMSSPHALELPRVIERADHDHPRRRTCI